MDLKNAERIATTLQTILNPACERIEIAGSIRRRKPDVKDIELVAVPRLGERLRSGNLFAQQRNLLLDCLDSMAANPKSSFVRGDKWGEKYRKLIYRHGADEIAVDLFMVEARSWGPQFALRTGPAEFSKRLVSPGPWGCMPDGYRLRDGRIVGETSGLQICHDAEADFFRFLGLPLWEPHERTEQRLAAYLDQHALTVAGR